MNHRNEPDLIYDVGMHKGEDSAYYLKKGFRVVGFEADPDLIAHCRTRFEREIDEGELTIIEGAIARGSPDADPHIEFYKNDDATVWGTVVPSWARRNEALGSSSSIISVPVVDFVESLEKYGIPHYMKVDIEGMDTECLRSLLHFERRPSFVSIESSKTSFPAVLEELVLLSKLGYDRFKPVQQLSVPAQVEPDPAREGVYVGAQFEIGSSGLFGEDLPGTWRSRDEVEDHYRKVFVLYALFGDHGALRRHAWGRLLRKGLQAALRRPIPGWYDTHARLATDHRAG